MVPGVPSDTTASAERVLTGYRGDVNLDGTLSVLDAVQLQKHLLNIGTIEKETACNYADLTEDGFINCLDLAYLKHCLMDPESWIGIYEEHRSQELEAKREKDMEGCISYSEWQEMKKHLSTKQCNNESKIKENRTAKL